MIFYPTIEQVEKADMIQLAKWKKFLPAPGMIGMSTPNFSITLKEETTILERIKQRLEEIE